MAGDENTTFTQEDVERMIAEREAGLKANRDEALKEAKAAKAALKNYEGVDPERYKQLLAASEEADRRKATAEGDFKALEKQLVDRHTSELSEREKRIEKLTKAVERRAIENELRAALTKARAYPEEMDLLVEHGARYGRLKETDDDFLAEIVEGGNPLVADSKGTPMNWDSLVEQKLKTKFPRLFEGSGSSGGGASKSVGGAAGGIRKISASDAVGIATYAADISAGRAEIVTG